ncbi:aldo/keto reductase [Marinicella meishanensis]|uniref:aldo/keto reductase n=1 Tax=Marinicella meishanensis TaxID=2873263 RepID=UPI001CBBD6A9|nr:aldo/keto reductase [Marinicella sp. NBU2979]
MLNRRTVLQRLAALGLAINTPLLSANNQPSPGLLKTIPKTGAAIPAIGMGTWITFDHNPAHTELTRYQQILQAFFAGGGRLIDSSPMYGFAQKLLGAVLPQVAGADSLFAATKVWTRGQAMGQVQMQESLNLWGLESMALMQIHNMLDWQAHLPTLQQWQAEGRIQYTGITTSHGRRHRELVSMLQQYPVDFVQFTYNMHDREAEQELLPLADDLGVAVIINRPFQTGGLFARVRGRALPDWSKDLGCHTWAQFFLKFVISHPAVTCAIPATSQVQHMQENMQAMQGPIPDSTMRQAMLKYYQRIIQ